MAHDPPFEISPELNALAERNVEQARAAYRLFVDFLTGAMNATSKTSRNMMLPAFSPIQERAIEFANENAERFFLLATELAQAKDIQTVLTLESQYAQNQMQAYAAQAQELGRLMANAMPTLSRTISIT